MCSKTEKLRLLLGWGVRRVLDAAMRKRAQLAVEQELYYPPDTQGTLGYEAMIVARKMNELQVEMLRSMLHDLGADT